MSGIEKPVFEKIHVFIAESISPMNNFSLHMKTKGYKYVVTIKVVKQLSKCTPHLCRFRFFYHYMSVSWGDQGLNSTVQMLTVLSL